MNGSGVRPLSESLGLVAREVADLAQVGDQLQGLISRLASANGQPDPRALIEAQAADLLSQRLEGLAGFIRALADAAPQELSTDVTEALRTLNLAEQARRLSGAPPSSIPDPSAELATFWD